MAGRAEVLESEVFSVDGREFRWRDVVTAAQAWSDWEEIEGRALEALNSRGAVTELPQEELEAAQNEFRYERNLLAADDLEAWLEGWGLTVQDWLEQVQAAVYRRHATSAGVRVDPADDAALASAAWAEAVCSGELERLARKLAERCAIWDSIDEGPTTGLGADELAGMEEAHRRFRDAAASDAALERQVRDEGLEWTRIDGRYLAHADEDVVREAALCVREEGRELDEMAQAAGARYEAAARFYLADAEPDLKARLMAAGAGELHGPLPSGDEHWLLEVNARVPPSLEDPAIRARAAAKVAERAVEQKLLQRVRWRMGLVT